MVRSSIWLVLLFLQSAFADKGRGGNAAVTDGGGGDEAAVSVSTTSSSALSSNGSSTQSSAPPAITPSAPALSFLLPSNATTCTPVTLEWQVMLPTSNVTDVDVHLLITNDGVHQAAPPYSSSTVGTPMRRQLPAVIISRDITNSTSLLSGSFNWSAVTVPAGWYILEAYPSSLYWSGLATQSAQFFVTAGSNTTCVYPNISTAAPSASSPHTKLSPGALAGTIIGTIVGVTALLAAFALPRLWRRGVPGHRAWKEKRGGLYSVF